MLSRFRDFLRARTGRPLEQSRFLLGVSGGIDSMVMLDFARRLRLAGGVATVNYGLRQAAAGDAELVQLTCRRFNYPFHLLTPSPRSYSGNLQDQARRLRLEFFHSLCETEEYDWILLANHADDLAETLLVRQLQGRHPLSWGGFAPQQGIVLRPFIDVDRAQIEKWAAKYGVTWCEDESNRGDDYLRNRVRHHLLPLMAQLVPDREGTQLQRSARQLQRTGSILEELLDRESVRCLLQKGADRFVLDKVQLRDYTSALRWQLLFRWLQQLNDWIDPPSEALMEQVLTNLRRLRGSMRIGKRLLMRHDADRLLLVRIDRELPEIPLRRNGRRQTLPGTGRVSCRLVAPGQVSFDRDPHLEFLSLPDGATCRYRPWRPGDTYIPLGRRRPRRVADLLSSRGVLDRTAAYVLECNGLIAWVVGQAPAASFRVSGRKDNIYKFRMVMDE